MTLALQRPWLLALLVGLVAAGAAGLVSAHNGDPAAIHACVNQASSPRGQVIIYSAPGLTGAEPATSTCGTRGTPVDWGQTGGVGATGPAGTTGASGPSGPLGTSVYAEVFAAGQLVAGAGGAVTWNPGQGVNVTTTPSGFTILTGGVYRVQASCATVTVPTSFAIAVNGSATSASLVASTGACNTAVLIQALNPGNTVSFINISGPVTMLVAAPGSATAATMDIVKLS
jgi:hypothetical protein